MLKKCEICGKEFETIQYGNSRKYCFSCSPPNTTLAERTKIKRQSAKIEGVKRLGGKCMKCGETRPYILAFHHIDPNENLDYLNLKHSIWYHPVTGKKSNHSFFDLYEEALTKTINVIKAYLNPLFSFISSSNFFCCSSSTSSIFISFVSLCASSVYM